MPATKRNFILPSGIGISADNIYASNTTNSTSTTTGSFVSLGGAGIAKSVSIGGYLQLFNGSNFTAFVSSASGNTVYTLPATTPSTGTSVLQSTASGVMSWVPMTATGSASGFTTLNGLTSGIQYFATGTSGSGFNISSSGSTHTFNIPIAGSGSTGLISTGTQTIAGAKTFSSDLLISSSTASTNSSAGALVVTGGVGIGETLFVAGNISVNTGTNGLLFRKLVAGNFGAIYSTNITPSTTNYSFITDGASVSLNGTNGVYLNINNTNKIQVTTNNINIVPTADSTSTTTGALTVAGGVGIGGSLYVASATAISGVSLNAGIITGNLTGTATTATNVNVVFANSNVSHPVLFTPTSGSASGVAISSNSTLVYNPSTDTLTASAIAITSSTASTSTSTGALIVTGGVGIGQSVSVGGRLQLFNSSNYTAIVSSASGNTVYTLPATSPATGSSVLQSTSAGVMSWVPLTASGGVAVSGTTDGVVQFKAGSALGATASLFFDTNLLGLRISGFPGGNTPSGTDAVLKLEGVANSFNGSTNGTYYAANAPSGFAGDLMNLQVNAVSKFRIDNTGAIIQNIGTNSTSTTSGAVQIKGGVGITGAVFVGESINATSTTNSTNTSTGSLIVSGGAGFAGTINVGGTQKIFSSTASTNTWTGALTVGGGVGISGQLTFAQASFGYTGINFNPSMSFIGNTSSSPITLTVLTDNSLNWEGPQGSVFSIDSNLSSGEIFAVSDISGLPIISASAGQTVTINEFGGYTQIGNGTVTSSSTSTGALVVSGGLGVTANAFIGGTTTITNTTSSTGTNSGAFVVSGGLGLLGNAFIGGTVTLNNGTNSSGTNSGSLVVNGGLGITGNANIGGTVRITNTTASTSSSTGALVVSGGSGIGGSLYVGSNLIFTGQMRGGTNTYAKNLGNGDIALDNGTDDTPALLYYWNNNKNFGLDVFYSGSGTTKFRIVKELNESGGTELWSLDRNGLVTRSAWAPGETINTAMYNYSDLNMASTTTISSTTYTTFATVTYTPKSSTSYLWIEFSCTYTVSGTTTDDFWSNIEVAGSEIVNSNQVWTGQVGGGTRSGVMFPLAARYTNTGTAGIAISVRSKRGTSDDNTTIYGNAASGFMRIQEIGR